VIDRLRIVVPPHAIVDDEFRQKLRQAHPRVDIISITSRDELSEQLPSADALLLLPGFIPSEDMFASAARLRWVHSGPAGIDHIMTPALETMGDHVTFTASKGPFAIPLAEHAVSLMLTLARRSADLARAQIDREWTRGRWLGKFVELSGKTILILGVGAAGGHLARICQAGFGMRVLGMTNSRRDNPHVDRFVDRDRLFDALAEADFVALCLPSTPTTGHIVDAAALEVMKPTSFLINVARGELIDEEALVAALRSNRIAGAGLDTFTTEPLPADSPLWSLPNVVVTPHTANSSDRIKAHLMDFIAENVRRFAEGEPLLGLVDRQGGY
jgi:phosphoglycerate dehydrogenase-like enzyme